MRDEDKTRDQLIDELNALRNRLRQMESGPAPPGRSCSRESGSLIVSPPMEDFTELVWNPQDMDLPVVDEVPGDQSLPEFLSARPLPLESQDEGSIPITESGSFDLRWITMASFGKLLHAVPMPIVLAGATGRIILENYAFMTLSGELWSMTGESLYSLFPDRDHGRQVQSLVEAVLDQRSAKVREGCLVINGREIWSRMHIRALRFGQERSVLVLIQDLTQEKRESALNAKCRTLVQIFPIGMAEFILQPAASLNLPERELASTILSGRLVEGNVQFARLYGRGEADEVRGVELRELVPEGGPDHARIRQWVKQRFPIRWSESKEAQPDGTVKYYETMLVGNFRDDTLVEFWLMKQDITDHKRAQEELLAKIRTIDELYEHVVQSEKAKAISEHTATVAHELRQPLTIIGGFARRMEKECAKCEMAKEGKWFGVIVREVQRLEKILAGLIDFSRREDINLKRVDPAEIISYVLSIHEERLTEKNLQVRFQHGQEAGKILVDPDRFQHVMRNLIANAIEASPPNEQILIETAVAIPSDKAARTGELTSAMYYEIKIHNRGNPIHPSHLKKVFNPFFTTKDLGTGLGLTLSKKIVEDHGGSISVKSDEVGTILTVWLPMPESLDDTVEIARHLIQPPEDPGTEE